MSSSAPDNLGIPDVTGPVEIGAGGFGTVYRARQESLRRDVAVKIISNKLRDERVRVRFEREIQAMGMLSGHPNIVTVYDSGFTESGQPFILMDYMVKGALGVDSVPLPVAPQTAVRMAIKVCGALETAHQAGILHRDIKPENIMVSAYDEPKLGDFGIARLKGGPETRTSSLTASIEHVAPELLEGDPPSIASEVYAMGSTLYKMLTAEAPFFLPTDESIVPALTRIRDQPVPDLRRRGIPEPITVVVNRAMSKDPSLRYPSVLEMGRDLQRAQELLRWPRTEIPVQEAEARAVRKQHDELGSYSLDSTRLNQPGVGTPTNGLGLPTVATAVPLPTVPTKKPAVTGSILPPATGPVVGPSSASTSGSERDINRSTTPIVPGIPEVPPPLDLPYTEVKLRVLSRIAIGLVVVALIGIAGVFTFRYLSARNLEPYSTFTWASDDSDTVAVRVPQLWSQHDSGSWTTQDEYGNEIVLGTYLTATPALESFNDSWLTPGVQVFHSWALPQKGVTPDDVVEWYTARASCSADERSTYAGGRYTGAQIDYHRCGDTTTDVTVVAVWPETQDQIMLLVFVGTDDRDDAALAEALESFGRSEYAD